MIFISKKKKKDAFNDIFSSAFALFIAFRTWENFILHFSQKPSTIHRQAQEQQLQSSLAILGE